MGYEGFLTLTVSVRVRPEPCVADLMRRYKLALQYAVNWILDRSVVVQDGKRVRYFTPRLSEVHRGLYETLKKIYGLPSKIAQDCYRNALAIAKSWLGNGVKGKRPTVRNISLWLTPISGYRICNNHVELAGGCKLEVIGVDKRYEGYEHKEARLVQRGNKLFLHVAVRIPKPKQYEPRGVVAVDVNEHHVYFGNSQRVERVETAVERAERQRQLAERLQRKYSLLRYPAWKRRMGILSRIRYFHRRARNIVENWARKTALLIAATALSLQSAVAREDLTGLKDVLGRLPYEHRRRATWLSYRRLAWWIDWQAAKRGAPAVVIDPRGTSTTCPRCGHKLVEVRPRCMKCAKCGFEADRDVVAVFNIEKRAQVGGPLTAPTAPQMTDVTPNRWGEPMSRPRGKSLRTGRRSAF